jgi:hypothetical protein
MSKRLLVGAVSVLLLGGAAALLVSRRSQGDVGLDQRGDDVAALRDEVKRLRRDLALVRTQSAETAARQPPPAASTSPEPRPPETRKALTADEKKAQTRAAVQGWYRTIDAQFDTETDDPSWSPDATRGFEELLKKHAEHATLMSAKCANTMCRIVVSHADGDKQREFASEMSDESALDTEVAYKYDAEATPPTTTMWVARQGHKVPRMVRK